MSPLLAYVSIICLTALLAAAAVCLYRLALGPTAADRAVAFDTLVAVFIAIVCVLCIRWDSVLYFDGVWILTLVGFLGTAAIARFLDRGRVF
jgi:multisubunit Na+/H+ antiporter MnhF subunit